MSFFLAASHGNLENSPELCVLQLCAPLVGAAGFVICQLIPDASLSGPASHGDGILAPCRASPSRGGTRTFCEPRGGCVRATGREDNMGAP